MVEWSPNIPFYVALLVGSVAVLTALAVFAILWRELWLGLFALAVQAAVRFGLYDPAASEQTVQKRKPDSGLLLFSKALRAACRLMPGDSNRQPHTIIVPAFCLGIPALLLAFVLLRVVPLYLLAYVMGLSSRTDRLRVQTV